MNKYRVEPKGLGDTLSNLTYITGVRTVVKKIFGEDCGCEKRQEVLNKLIPYKNERTDHTEPTSVD